MKYSKFLSLGASVAILSLAAACSSGSGNPTTGEEGGANAGTGGATSNGGNGATGGSTSTGCATTTLFTFESDQQGWSLDTSVGTTVDVSDDSGKGLPYLNLAAPGDAGVVAVAPGLGWSGAQDYDIAANRKGSLAISAQYSNWNQSITAQVGGLVDTATGEVVDLVDKIISFHVKITGEGLTTSDNAGGGMVFLKTGSAYVWGQGAWTSIVGTDSWVSLSINTKSPAEKLAGWDASAPKQLGIQISSSGGGGTAAAPKPYGAPRNVVVFIDNITVTCAP